MTWMIQKKKPKIFSKKKPDTETIFDMFPFIENTNTLSQKNCMVWGGKANTN
jgi:hypothetical protein